ncbi:MAG: DegT/DnrJ/EryC1/StrS family aminotransferase [Terriglobia bacterium]|jgi:dTDP-4-amino-4,6-dideoxygalactose transaminase
MDQAKRKEILARGGLSQAWQAEPMLGGWYTEEEIEAAVSAIRSSLDPAVGFGFFCDEIVEFEQKFAAYIGTRYALSVTSAGSGLDVAVHALDLEPGDEVIVPAMNFRAAPYAVLGVGAKLVLCDSDERTLNADPADVEAKMTPRTRAILVTHMNGLSAPMPDYQKIAERHPHPKYGPPKVIGDAARALGGGYQGGKIGKQGWMTVFSLHTMKMMTTLGEGGMITTDDPDLMLRLRAIRQWGIAVSEDLEIARGKKGTGDMGWGSNYKMTKIQAAVGLVQLRRLDEMIAPRVALAHKRTEMLRDVPELTLPFVPTGHEAVYYLYNLLVPREWAGAKRDQLMAILRKDYGVDTVVANPPVYQNDAFVRRMTEGQSCPRAEELGARLFNPPMHPQMSDADNEYICAAIAEAVDRVRG